MAVTELILRGGDPIDPPARLQEPKTLAASG